MEFLKEYGQKYGFGIDIKTWDQPKRFRIRIAFLNDCIAEIYSCDHRKNHKSKYTVAAYDHQGYHVYYDTLNKMGAENGTFHCNSELEIIIACENIRRLS